MRKKRMMRVWLPVFIACACSVLLCCGRSQQENRASSQNGNAPVESQNSNAPRYVSAQFAESAKSLARADLLDCRNTDSKITRGSDLSVEEVAKRLQGTWVRRLTMHGVPIETNSFLYFD